MSWHVGLMTLGGGGEGDGAHLLDSRGGAPRRTSEGPPRPPRHRVQTSGMPWLSSDLPQSESPLLSGWRHARLRSFPRSGRFAFRLDIGGGVQASSLSSSAGSAPPPFIPWHNAAICPARRRVLAGAPAAGGCGGGRRDVCDPLCPVGHRPAAAQERPPMGDSKHPCGATRA